MKVITELNEYQEAATKTKLDAANNLSYLALGLCGEAGEVAEHIKKSIRDGTLDKDKVALELGDVLWYLANLSDSLGFNLTEIANLNILKLKSRQERNKLKGSGDDR